LQRVDLFLAQSEEDGRRLVAMGARESAVRAIGNLKYDVRAAKESRVAELIREVAGGRPIVVAGSTVDRVNDKRLSEDEMVIQAWEGAVRRGFGALLVIAPRHPERFGEVEAVAREFAYVRASDWGAEREGNPPFAKSAKDGPPGSEDGAPGFEAGARGMVEIVLLDTVGDLAAVYGVADVAFVGGSLVRRGGHNPLEPAQFGVPVVMGPSYENFRDVVGKMQAADGIRILGEVAGLSATTAKGATSGRDDSSLLKDELEAALVELLTDREKAKAMGERGRRVFEEQQGATGRAVAALLELVKR
jgi:3-deoxy-D-manno-octulosonic-acid transferase